MCEATRKTSETDGTMSSLSQTFSYDFENEAMMAKFRWLAQPEGQDHGWSQQISLTSWTSNGTTLNQTQSWNLSLEGAWNSTTVNGNTETRTFNQTYETLFSNANPMSHDRKGNLTQNKDGSLFTWDFDNQLAFSTAGTPSVNAAYAYDALGRRVSKSSGNTVTVFVHSNYQIATEYKSVNGGAFTEHQSFVYATYIDDPIALISTNGTYFYHSNQQYSIAAITDSNGNLSERYGYNAYGKPVVITDSILVDNPYFFTGRQLDLETGLFYFRARYYDASLGQFISRDPLNYVDGMNLYRGYFAVNFVDSFGLNKECGFCFNIKSAKVTSCSALNISTSGCGYLVTNHINEKRLCDAIIEMLEGVKKKKPEGIKVECKSGCKCQDEKDLTGQAVNRAFNGIVIDYTKDKPTCKITVDLTVNITVGEGKEGTCKEPKKEVGCNDNVIQGESEGILARS